MASPTRCRPSYPEDVLQQCELDGAPPEGLAFLRAASDFELVPVEPLEDGLVELKVCGWVEHVYEILPRDRQGAQMESRDEGSGGAPSASSGGLRPS